MDKAISKKRAKNLWVIWLVSFLIGGGIYQLISINDAIEAGLVSDALLRIHNILWFIAILIYYYPLLFKVHKYAQDAEATKLKLIVRVLIVMFSLGIVVTSISIVATLLS